MGQFFSSFRTTSEEKETYQEIKGPVVILSASPLIVKYIDSLTENLEIGQAILSVYGSFHDFEVCWCIRV